MLLTGIGLALVLWVLALTFQSSPAPTPTPSESDIAQRSAQTAPQDSPAAPPQTPPQSANEYINRAPSFTAARLQGGRLALSGQGAPGAGLNLMYGEDVIAVVKADGQGAWSAQAPFLFQGDAAVLDLLMTTPDGLQIRSDQDILWSSAATEDAPHDARPVPVPHLLEDAIAAPPPLLLLAQPQNPLR